MVAVEGAKGLSKWLYMAGSAVGPSPDPAPQTEVRPRQRSLNPDEGTGFGLNNREKRNLRIIGVAVLAGVSVVSLLKK